jgi:hypothetical protein
MYLIRLWFWFWCFQKLTATFQSLSDWIEILEFWTWRWRKFKKSISQLPVQHNDNQHNDTVCMVMLSFWVSLMGNLQIVAFKLTMQTVIMLSVCWVSLCCQYAGCSHAQCHYAESRPSIVQVKCFEHVGARVGEAKSKVL